MGGEGKEDWECGGLYDARYCALAMAVGFEFARISTARTLTMHCFDLHRLGIGTDPYSGQHTMPSHGRMPCTLSKTSQKSFPRF